jgi:uncharacterized protein
MKCPRCNADMNEVVKHSVTIDFCAACGGMWLDKGELAKIVSELKAAEVSLENEFSAARSGGSRPAEPPVYERRPDDDRHYDQYRNTHDSHHGHGGYHGYPHRKKSAFEKIFDIFD